MKNLGRGVSVVALFVFCAGFTDGHGVVAYLKIEGVTGVSKATGHLGWIPLTSTRLTHQGEGGDKKNSDGPQTITFTKKNG